MPPKQKQKIIKKPAGNGNISITIENNLKNTNIAPPVVKKKKKKKKQNTNRRSKFTTITTTERRFLYKTSF
jgi:hypothetical protein